MSKSGLLAATAAMLAATEREEVVKKQEEEYLFSNPYGELGSYFPFMLSLPRFNSAIFTPSKHTKQSYADHRRQKAKRKNKKLRPNSYK